jgi:hypothetical protein
MGSEVNPPKRKYVKKPNEVEWKQALVDYEAKKLWKQEEKRHNQNEWQRQCCVLWKEHVTMQDGNAQQKREEIEHVIGVYEQVMEEWNHYRIANLIVEFISKALPVCLRLIIISLWWRKPFIMSRYVIICVKEVSRICDSVWTRQLG